MVFSNTEYDFQWIIQGGKNC